MIDPTKYDSYPDYFLACQAENEIPADAKTWSAWKYPDSAAPEALPTAPSAYLQWLVEQLPDLKFAAHQDDDRAEILWNVIRELRLQDERLRGIEKALRDMEAGK